MIKRLNDIPDWKRTTKYFYIIGIIFWLSFFVVALLNLFIYNSLFGLLQTNQINVKEFAINKKDENTLAITYSYFVDNILYSKNRNVGVHYFDENFLLQSDSSFVVKYNSTFPNYSYIESLPLEIRNQKGQMIVSLIFMLFLTVTWKISNRK